LNSYSWKKFARRPNPVASALMVKMRIPVKDRPFVKLACLRLLLTLKLDNARQNMITVFMNSYLELTEQEEVV
jgi:hypothetical protein